MSEDTQPTPDILDHSQDEPPVPNAHNEDPVWYPGVVTHNAEAVYATKGNIVKD